MESTMNVKLDEPEPSGKIVDFSNTQIAFSFKTDAELKRTVFLFKMMNSPFLVKVFSFLALWAIKLRLPFTEYLIKQTIFKQFVGGDTLLQCQKTIDLLYDFDTLTILDYGAEGKSDEDDLDQVMFENMRAIEMAASNNSVPVISTKITGLVRNEILEKKHAGIALNQHETELFEHLIERVERICSKAAEHGVGVFIDAEESWIQDPIDEITMEMMEKYNNEKVIVYNTYQMYQKAKLDQLKRDHAYAKSNGFMLGAKLVRGAYMEKENKRAQQMGYPSPIHDSKQNTDDHYDEGIQYCLEHYEEISLCNASHNLLSNLKMARYIVENGLDKSHSHLNFCQLYGMSDYITFNLAHEGFTVAKYVPYGPVKEVIPYLIRRAQENSSVTGETSRELTLLHKEMDRRKI